MQNRVFRRLGVYLAGLLTLTACIGSSRTDSESQDTQAPQVVEVKYARNFVLDDSNLDVRLLTIRNPEDGKGTEYKYALVRGEVDKASLPAGYEVVRIPVQRFICMTSLQLSNFIAIDQTLKIAGITSTRHLFDEQMRKQLEEGRTVQIGIEGEFDNELIIAADPQLILVSPSKRGGYEALKESGLPIMPHMGYLEADPLGQAEWVKLIGVLTGHEADAVAYFEGVEKRYNELKAKVQAQTQSQPRTIFSGDMKGGAWYATGGRSFLASIFRDAGADYVLSDNEDTGGVNMDFEAIYAKAADVDYWRISNSYDGEFTYDVLRQQDSRFADFKAFRQKQVIYCNMSKTPFYESFPVHPDLVLADFVKVFQPELLPDYTPTYYRLLEK